MVKNKKIKSFSYFSAAVALLVGLAIGLAVGYTISKPSSPPTKSKFPYVDGPDATTQVANFYRQYINDANNSEFQKRLIGAYGDQNLIFYNQYYQHGFNPITCSNTMPRKVTAALSSTGPVAVVNTTEQYSNGSESILVARVVLQDKGLAIDSITCPGAKGNLPPA